MTEPAAPPLRVARAVAGGAAFQVIPTAGIDVLSWSCDKPLGILTSDTSTHEARDGAKVVLVEMHPTQPWILSCDKDGEVFLWDFFVNKLLLRRSVQDIYRYGGKEDSSLSFDYRPRTPSAPSSSSRHHHQHHSTTAGIPPIDRCDAAGYTIAQQLEQRKARVHLPSPLSEQIFGFANQNNSGINDERDVEYVPPVPPTGQIRQIAFADKQSVAYRTGNTSS